MTVKDQIYPSISRGKAGAFLQDLNREPLAHQAHEQVCQTSPFGCSLDDIIGNHT